MLPIRRAFEPFRLGGAFLAPPLGVQDGLLVTPAESEHQEDMYGLMVQIKSVT